MSTPSERIDADPGMTVPLLEVEDALDRLWGPAAEKAGGPDLEDPEVTRIALANVVLVRLGPDTPGLDETIRAITTQYPSRLIVLRRSDEAVEPLTADVSAQCHLPAPGRPQVCSEVVTLRAAAEADHLLPGAVRMLRDSDLPNVLWWVDPPGPSPALFHQLADDASRVILDWPDPSAMLRDFADLLATGTGLPARDLSWFRSNPWRELIARCFDGVRLGDLDRIASIRVRTEGSGVGLPRVGLWLVAWLAGQLGWTFEGASSPEQFDAANSLDLRFSGRSVPIDARVETRDHGVDGPARIASVDLEFRDPDDRLSLARSDADPTEIRIRRFENGADAASNRASIRDIDFTRSLSAALLDSRADPPYGRAAEIVRQVAANDPKGAEATAADRI